MKSDLVHICQSVGTIIALILLCNSYSSNAKLARDNEDLKHRYIREANESINKDAQVWIEKSKLNICEDEVQYLTALVDVAKRAAK